jgi:hypothetical protein
MEKFSNTLELKTIPEGQTVVFKSIVVIRKIERRNAKNGSEFLRIEVGAAFRSRISEASSGGEAWRFRSRSAGNFQYPQSPRRGRASPQGAAWSPF